MRSAALQRKWTFGRFSSGGPHALAVAAHGASGRCGGCLLAFHVETLVVYDFGAMVENSAGSYMKRLSI